MKKLIVGAIFLMLCSSSFSGDVNLYRYDFGDPGGGIDAPAPPDSQTGTSMQPGGDGSALRQSTHEYQVVLSNGEIYSLKLVSLWSSENPNGFDSYLSLDQDLVLGFSYDRSGTILGMVLYHNEFGTVFSGLVREMSKRDFETFAFYFNDLLDYEINVEGDSQDFVRELRQVFLDDYYGFYGVETCRSISSFTLLKILELGSGSTSISSFKGKEATVFNPLDGLASGVKQLDSNRCINKP